MKRNVTSRHLSFEMSTPTSTMNISTSTSTAENIDKYAPSSAGGLNSATRLYISLWMVVFFLIITFFLVWLVLVTWKKHKKEAESLTRSCPLRDNLVSCSLPQAEYAELDDVTQSEGWYWDHHPDTLWVKERNCFAESEM